MSRLVAAVAALATALVLAPGPAGAAPGPWAVKAEKRLNALHCDAGRADGRLDPRRLASWQHLTAELDRLDDERAEAGRSARRGRPPRVVESDAEDVAD